MKNLTKILLLSLAAILLGVLSVGLIINITGGLGVSKSHIAKELASLHSNENADAKVRLKFGSHLNFIGSNINIKTPDFNIKASIFGVKKSFLSIFSKEEKVSEVFLEDSEITIFLKQNETIKDALLKIYSDLSAGISLSRKITFLNVDFIFTPTLNQDTDSSEKSETPNIFKIENVEGTIEKMNDQITINSTLQIGGETYKLESLFEGKNELSFKLESKNHSFKISLKDNVGKVMAAINNLTKFLNDITPDTLNIDLKALDSQKNAIYFESNVVYNDIKKSVEFSNTIFQAFGNKEEEMIIHSLSDNTYKIDLEIPELNMVETTIASPLVVNESKTPMLQFSNFIPEVKILLNANINKINVKRGEKTDVISDSSLSADFAYGKINFNLGFKFNENFAFKSAGFLENFEEENRKIFARSEVSVKDFDFSSFNILNTAKYQRPQKTDMEISFDTTILGSSSIVFDDISIDAKQDFKIRGSKLQYDLYKKNADYEIDLNLENADLSLIKVNLGSSFKAPGGDLFRIMFDYLKFKQFSYIKFNCSKCRMEDEALANIRLEYFITPGKVELAEFRLKSPNLAFNMRGIIDIRNPASNVSNLALNIEKWDGFSTEKLFGLSDIFEGFDEFKLPSFEGFRGQVRFESPLISNRPLTGAPVDNTKINALRNTSVILSLNNGVLKAVSSKTSINGFENKNFLALEVILNGNTPSASGNVAIAGLEAAPIIQKIVEKKNYNGISGIFSMSASFTTSGFLIKDIMKNIQGSIEMKSPKIKVAEFNLEAISNSLLNRGASFKKITNTELQEKITGSPGFFEVQSVMKIAGREISIESADLKSLNSSSIFVGKYTSGENARLQLLGKTAIFGANLNSGLKGAMPIYITKSISFQAKGKTENAEVKSRTLSPSNEVAAKSSRMAPIKADSPMNTDAEQNATNEDAEPAIQKKLDYSQLNKYAEVRRVLFK